MIELVARTRHELATIANSKRIQDTNHVSALLADLDHQLLADQDADVPLIAVCPPALADLPWSGLPSRIGTSTTVARSASAWYHASSRPVGGSRSVIIDGPDLAYAESEASAVTRIAPLAHHVEATTDIDALLGALEGARVAHMVSHGYIRTDNPLFSTLRTKAGDLYAYQLLRVDPSPAVAVLSACHLGLGSDQTGGRLLGFTDVLLNAGTSSVIASTLPVPDTAVTVDLMVDLHRRLAAGERPAAALGSAQAALPETIRPLYAAAFTCFGGG